MLAEKLLGKEIERPTILEERKKVDGTRNPMLAVLSNNFLLRLFPHVYLHVLWRFCCRPWMAGNKNKNYTERMVIQWWDEEIKFVSNFFLTMTPRWFIRCIPRSLFVSSVVVPLHISEHPSGQPASQSVSLPFHVILCPLFIFIYFIETCVVFNIATTTAPPVALSLSCLVIIHQATAQVFGTCSKEYNT